MNQRKKNSLRYASIRTPLVLFLAAATLLATTPVEAQNLKRMRKVVGEATRLALEGKYDDAISKYIEAKTIQDDPLLDYNIARCYHKKGECEAAVRLYTTVIDRPDSDPETIADAERYREELGTCGVPEPVEPAVVEPPKEEPVVVAVEPPPDEMSTMAYAGWGATIGGGALILTGFAVDVGSSSLGDDLEAAAARGDRAEYDQLQDDIDSRQTTILVMYGLGAAAAAAGGVLLYLDMTATSEESTVTFLPTLGPDGASAHIRLTF